MLKIDKNLEAMRKISLCVRPEIDKRELSMRTAPPTHVLAISREMEKWRNLGLDARDKAAELGYFRNKAARLIEEYETNLTYQGCR
jgi:hypothetical protein